MLFSYKCGELDHGSQPLTAHMLASRELADARPVTHEEMLRQNALRRPQGGPPPAWQLSEYEALLLAQLPFLYKCGDDAGSFCTTMPDVADEMDEINLAVEVKLLCRPLRRLKCLWRQRRLTTAPATPPIL